MIAQWHGDRVTVMNGSGFVVMNETRRIALETLRKRGMSERAANIVLDRVVPEHECRAAFVAAAQATSGAKT